MATFTTTTNLALRWLPGTNKVKDIDTGFQALAEDVDARLGGPIPQILTAVPSVPFLPLWQPGSTDRKSVV